MANIKTLAGDTMIYGLSTILTRMLNYLMVPYLTRVMTQGEYGVVTDLYSLIPFALVVLTMGLESGYFRFAGSAADEDEKRRIFRTLWRLTCCVALVFLLLVGCFSNSIAPFLNYGDHPEYLRWTAGIIFFDVATALPFAKLREQRKRLAYVGLRLAAVVVNLGMCVYFYSVRNFSGVEWVLKANFAASALVFLALGFGKYEFKERWDFGMLRKVLIYSLPLLISGIAGTCNEFIDRQMIKWLMPADMAMPALGIYGATTKLAVIMILFTQMYRLAAEPFFLAKFGKRGEFARQSYTAMWLYVAVAMVIFVLIMVCKPLVVLILGEQFRGGDHLLPILLGANALAGVVFNLSLWYKQAERTWIALAVTGTGLVFTVALNLWLVPQMGYEGAAWARLGCEIAMVAVSLAFLLANKKQIEKL